MGTPCLGQLIIEITEPFETIYNPAEFAFVDLAEENQVTKFKIEKIFLVNCECSEENYAVKGTHFIEKDQKDMVIRLAVLRQPRFKTDIQVHMNTESKFDVPDLDDLFGAIIESLVFSEDDFKVLVG